MERYDIIWEFRGADKRTDILQGHVPTTYRIAKIIGCSHDRWGITSLAGKFCPSDLSHEVQRVEFWAACRGHKISAKVVAISTQEGMCRGTRVPRTIPCLIFVCTYCGSVTATCACYKSLLQVPLCEHVPSCVNGTWFCTWYRSLEHILVWTVHDFAYYTSLAWTGHNFVTSTCRCNRYLRGSVPLHCTN